MNLLTGIIRFYSPLKGCGYIQPDDGSLNVFVDKNDLERAGITSVEVGQRVMFELKGDEHKC